MRSISYKKEIKELEKTKSIEYLRVVDDLIRNISAYASDQQVLACKFIILFLNISLDNLPNLSHISGVRDFLSTHLIDTKEKFLNHSNLLTEILED